MSIVVTVEISGAGDAEPVLDGQKFSKDEIVLGRDPEADIPLQASNVSWAHAKLLNKQVANGGALFVVDLGSSNGTFLEDQKLPANTEVAVGENKRLVIGNFVITPALDRSSKSGSKKSRSKDKSSKKEGTADMKTPSQLSGSLFEKELEIKRTIHDQLIERLDLRQRDILALSDEDLRRKALKVVEVIIRDLRWEIPDGLDRELLIKQVLDEALGLGPLEELLAEEDCSEIMVNSHDQIFAEQEGRIELTPYRFSSERAVLGAIERILAPIGRRIDESSPLVDARLKDGSRVNAVIRPLALNGPCITIRKFRSNPLTIKDIVGFGALSQGMSDFLKMAVENRLNIVISGGTGSGKTTLLNVISGFIPNGQRVITVEDAAELRLPQEHVVSFETRPPNLEGRGAITIRDLVKNALRMRPDRIIVGECRGPEALDMLQAMNTGHDGSMTTGHANSPVDMVSRLETMVLTSGLDLPIRAVREQIASAVNLVIQQTRFSCGTRKVTSISEVVGMDLDDGIVVLEDIFMFREQGYGKDGKIQGVHQASGYVPKFFRKLQERGMPVDASVFSAG